MTEGAAVCSVDDVEQWKDKIDVMILCGGSATDLPEQTPKYAKVSDAIQRNVHQALTGEMEVKDALDTLQGELEELAK